MRHGDPGAVCVHSVSRGGDAVRRRRAVLPGIGQAGVAQALLRLPRGAEAEGRSAPRHGGADRGLRRGDERRTARPSDRRRSGRADAARGRGAGARASRRHPRLDRSGCARARRRSSGGRSGRALGVPADRTAPASRRPERQSHRRLPRRQARSAGFAGAAAGRARDSAAASVSRSDRAAADGGAMGERRRVRRGGGRAARQSAPRRTLGPPLDGRLALFGMVRPREPTPQQPETHLALAGLDRGVDQRGQGLRPHAARDAGGRRTGAGQARGGGGHWIPRAELLPVQPDHVAGRHDRAHRQGLPRPDHELRQVPRPQVRSGQPARLLPFPGHFRAAPGPPRSGAGRNGFREGRTAAGLRRSPRRGDPAAPARQSGRPRSGHRHRTGGARTVRGLRHRADAGRSAGRGLGAGGSGPRPARPAGGGATGA